MRLAKLILEQFQRERFSLGVVVGFLQQLIREHQSVFVHEQLFPTVNTNEKTDDVSQLTPFARAEFRSFRNNRFRIPRVSWETLKNLLRR